MSLTETNYPLALKQQLQQCLDQVQLARRYATLNVPAGSQNIGSYLLQLAEAHYFANDRNANMVYASSVEEYSYERLHSRVEDGMIVLRGGYLGDFWDLQGGRRRALFESIVRNFPKRQIVFMPQSVEYFDPVIRARATEIFQKHPNLTVIARDRRSLENAKQMFPPRQVLLAPDIVFQLAGLGLTSRPRRRRHSILYLCRDDWTAGPEFAPENLAVPGLVTHEWRTTATDAERAAAAEWMDTEPSMAFLRDVPPFAELHTAANFLFLAVTQLSQHRLVITNRLHGHIMCVILGIPHILLPGPYYKMASFHKTWTHPVADCRLVERGAQVRAAVDELLSLGDDLT